MLLCVCVWVVCVFVLQPWGRNALRMSVRLKKKDFFFYHNVGQDTKGGRRDAQELNEHRLAAVCEDAVLLMCALKCISGFSCLQGLSLRRICWQKEFWYRLFLRAVFWRTAPLSPGTAATLPACLSYPSINSADAQQSPPTPRLHPQPHVRCRREQPRAGPHTLKQDYLRGYSSACCLKLLYSHLCYKSRAGWDIPTQPEATGNPQVILRFRNFWPIEPWIF